MLKFWRNLSSTNKLRVLILGVLIIGAIVPLVWTLRRTNDWDSFALNFSTELISVAVTFVLLDWIIGTRQEKQRREEAEEALKSDLIERMGSTVREIAVEAVDELRRRGWLNDNSLNGQAFRNANLEEMNLSNANFTNVNLHRANLKKADLWATKLDDADLSGAWLNEARLWQASLRNTNLWQARLHNADLRQADLSGASLNEARLPNADLRETDLSNADLNGANFKDAQFNEKTRLPDGTYWTIETDIREFTINGYEDDLN